MYPVSTIFHVRCYLNPSSSEANSIRVQLRFLVVVVVVHIDNNDVEWNLTTI